MLEATTDSVYEDDLLDPEAEEIFSVKRFDNLQTVLIDFLLPTSIRKLEENCVDSFIYTTRCG